MDHVCDDDLLIHAKTDNVALAPGCAKWRKNRLDGYDEMIGEWYRKEVLGRGAHGVVHRGIVVRTGRSIAVKQIRAGGMRQAELQAAENEIRMVRPLRHPNVVRFLGIERAEDHLNIFLEYMDGGSLRAHLQTEGRMSEEQTADITRKMLLGLRYLHSQGITHRDIKSANVLLSKIGDVKLADFGTSKRTTQESVVSGIKGTPHWMAPEVIRAEPSLDWLLADVWSVGCTVVEMLTGSRPWPEMSNVIAAMFHISKGQSPPLNIEVSSDATSFIAACCSAEPQERHTVEMLLNHPFLLRTPRSPPQKGPCQLNVRRPAPSAGDQLEGRRSWDHDRNCLCPLASSTSDHRSDCRSFSSSSPSSSDRGREPYHGEDSSSWYAAEPSNDTRQQQEKQQQHRHCCRTESTSPPWGTDARASSIRRPPCRAHDVGCENTKISRSKDNQLKRRRWYLQQSWSRLGPHSPGCRGRRHSNGNNHEGISRDRGRHEQREAERDCSEDINTTRGTMMPPSEACGSTRAYDDDFACSRTRRGPDTYESCALMVGRKFQPLANCCSTGDTNNSNNSSIKKPFTQWSPQSPPSPPSPTLPSSPLSAGAPLSRASKTSDRRSPLERRFHATESNLQQTPTKQQQQQEGQQQLLKKTSSRFTRSNAFFSERGRGASLTGTGAGDTNGNRGERVTAMAWRGNTDHANTGRSPGSPKAASPVAIRHCHSSPTTGAEIIIGLNELEVPPPSTFSPNSNSTRRQGMGYSRPFAVIKAARQYVEQEAIGKERPNGPITGEYLEMERRQGLKCSKGASATGHATCGCISNLRMPTTCMRTKSAGVLGGTYKLPPLDHDPVLQSGSRIRRAGEGMGCVLDSRSRPGFRLVASAPSVSAKASVSVDGAGEGTVDAAQAVMDRFSSGGPASRFTLATGAAVTVALVADAAVDTDPNAPTTSESSNTTASVSPQVSLNNCLGSSATSHSESRPHARTVTNSFDHEKALRPTQRYASLLRTLAVVQGNGTEQAMASVRMATGMRMIGRSGAEDDSLPSSSCCQNGGG